MTPPIHSISLARASPFCVPLMTTRDALVVRPSMTRPFPPRGWIRPRSDGTRALVLRKRSILVGVDFEAAHRPLVPSRGERREGAHTRASLPTDVIENEGAFCVQGPPGTGKTYLACDVVEGWLKKDPHAEIPVRARSTTPSSYSETESYRGWRLRPRNSRQWRGLQIPWTHPIRNRTPQLQRRGQCLSCGHHSSMGLPKAGKPPSSGGTANPHQSSPGLTRSRHSYSSRRRPPPSSTKN